MRVLYVCLDRGIPIGGTKGASIHVAELLRALAAEGHETAVAARVVAHELAYPVFLAAAAARPIKGPGRILRRDLRELKLGPAFRSLVRRAIEEWRPDAVYERYALFRSEARAETQASRVPLVLEVNAPLAWEERRFRSLSLVRAARAAERRAWTGANLVVVPSHPMAERVRAAGQDRVLVVPNAVDPELFAPEDPTAIRSELGLEHNFVVAFSGSLKAWHDLDAIVDSVGGLPATVGAALLFIGDGPERARLERRAEAQGARAVFTGAVPHREVPRYLAAADVCVAGLPADPALDYFSPLKALEYLAAGRPTVVAEVGDLFELARAGVALSYRPGDASDLGRRLETLAGDPLLRQRLATAGPAFARERTWRAAVRQIMSEVGHLPRERRSIT